MKKFDTRLLSSGLVPLFVMGHFGHHLLTALPVPLLPMIRTDFALDYTRSGLVISAFILSYGIAQLPAGWLADRVGRQILIAVGICGVALAGLLVGLSQTYVMMIVFLVLMGVFGGGYHPAAPPLISAAVEPENRGRALGFHVVGGSASYFLAPLIAAAIAAIWGWRASFIGLAVPTIVFGIVFYVLLKRRLSAAKTEQSAAGIHKEAPPAPGRWRRLVPFLILTIFTQAIFISTISFVPLFVVDHFGASEETGAVFVAIFYSAGLWAAPLGGYLSDRWGRIPVVLSVCFLVGPTIYLLNVAPYSLGVAAVLLTIGMLMYIRMPVSEAYIVDQTPEHQRSTVLGIYYFGCLESGGVLTPLVGNLVDRFGFHSTFTITGAAVLVVTLLCSIWLRGSRE